MNNMPLAESLRPTTLNELVGQQHLTGKGSILRTKNGIIEENAMMEKIWKEREKQMEKAILNSSSLYGSVKGIAGASVSDIPLLDGGNEMPGAEEN